MPAATTRPARVPASRHGVTFARIISRVRTGTGVCTPPLVERPLQASVDDHRLAADVARALGREEADDVAELLRIAPAAQRDRGDVLRRRASGVELLEPCRRDPSRRDAVD